MDGTGRAWRRETPLPRQTLSIRLLLFDVLVFFLTARVRASLLRSMELGNKGGSKKKALPDTFYYYYFCSFFIVLCFIVLHLPGRSRPWFLHVTAVGSPSYAVF